VRADTDTAVAAPSPPLLQPHPATDAAMEEGGGTNPIDSLARGAAKVVQRQLIHDRGTIYIEEHQKLDEWEKEYESYAENELRKFRNSGEEDDSEVHKKIWDKRHEEECWGGRGTDHFGCNSPHFLSARGRHRVHVLYRVDLGSYF
jgi:hypothetical protein